MLHYKCVRDREAMEQAGVMGDGRGRAGDVCRLLFISGLSSFNPSIRLMPQISLIIINKTT